MAERLRFRGGGFVIQRKRHAGWIAGFVIIAAWQASSSLGWASPVFLPSPAGIAKALAGLALSGQLARDVSASLARILVGFSLGASAGLAFGLALGLVSHARAAGLPIVSALFPIPKIALLPLFILWFGIFETSKVLLIAVGTFFPVYLALVAGIRGVDRKLIEVGRVLRFGHARMVGRILLPAVLPTWLIGLRGGLGLGWMFVVAAEFMGASEGLGYLLIDGQQTGRAAAILASILSFAVLGKLTDAILVATGRRFVAWQDSVDTVR